MEARSQRRRRWVSTVAVSTSALLGLGFAPRANAFSLLGDFSAGTVQQTFEQAPRWSSVSGIADGIQVGVHPSVAGALSTAPGEDLLIEQRIVDAFAAWESPVLDFDITLGATGTVESTSAGFEIDLFAADSTNPIFAGSGFFGFALVDSSFGGSRMLTNGQSFDGYSITGVDLYLNIDLLATLAPLGQTTRLDALTRVLIHEIGHGIGLGHPNSNNPFGIETNYDTNFDPLDAMTIDPNDPFSALLASSNRHDETIMSNGPCGIPPVLPCPGAFFTALQLDDIGGRDVLYPVPEPSTGLLVGSGLLALGRTRRRRSVLDTR